MLAMLPIANAQRRKRAKKGKEECPTYSEEISGSLTTYDEFVIDSMAPKKDTVSDFVVIQDGKSVDSLATVQAKYQDKPQGPGYRIQIWTGQNHIYMQNNIDRFREQFEELELEVHDEYDNSFFRVKVGDFYENERLLAYRALVKIKETFPNALLVPADVKL